VTNTLCQFERVPDLQVEICLGWAAALDRNRYATTITWPDTSALMR